jgi:hypothetical protein
MRLGLFRYSRKSFLLFSTVVLAVFLMLRYIDQIMLSIADLVILGRLPVLGVVVSFEGLMSFIGLVICLVLLAKLKTNRQLRAVDFDRIAL